MKINLSKKLQSFESNRFDFIGMSYSSQSNNKFSDVNELDKIFLKLINKYNLEYDLKLDFIRELFKNKIKKILV